MLLLMLTACPATDPCARPMADLWCDLTVPGGRFHCRDADRHATAIILEGVGERLRIHHLRRRAWPTDLASAYDADPVPTDAWGHPLELRARPGGHVEVISFGEDGLPGGTCQGTDLVKVVAPPS